MARCSTTAATTASSDPLAGAGSSFAGPPAADPVHPGAGSLTSCVVGSYQHGQDLTEVDCSGFAQSTTATSIAFHVIVTNT